VNQSFFEKLNLLKKEKVENKDELIPNRLYNYLNKFRRDQREILEKKRRRQLN